jgi:hypothetical protein
MKKPMQPRARMFAAWAVSGICFAPLLLAVFLEHRLTPWLFAPVFLGMLGATYFRRMLRPCFPEMMDRQNPFWERIVACLAAVTVMIMYYVYWRLSLGRIVGNSALAVLVLCSITSDARFVRNLRRNEEGKPIEDMRA